MIAIEAEATALRFYMFVVIFSARAFCNDRGVDFYFITTRITSSNTDSAPAMFQRSMLFFNSSGMPLLRSGWDM
ncbi:MAG TPA: hypothetical protein VF883_04205 [Thermoanaerobaculia bacterium]|jgi:hypothetical protein